MVSLYDARGRQRGKKREKTGNIYTRRCWLGGKQDDDGSSVEGFCCCSRKQINKHKFFLLN